MLVEAVQSLLVKIGENKMTKQKFNNIWTKLGLGNLRGNDEFSSVWRGLRVAVAYFIVGGGLNWLVPNIPVQYQPLIIALSAGVEKWARKKVKQLDN